MSDIVEMEAISFVRAQREKELARDPVHFYELTAVDGSTQGPIYEMHESKAAELNAERMWAYMTSQRKREEARLAFIAKQKDEGKIARCLANLQADLAAKAATADIPLPQTKAARELLEHRKLNPVIPRSEGRQFPISEPEIAYNDADYLWTRTTCGGGPVVTMTGTRRGRHD